MEDGKEVESEKKEIFHKALCGKEEGSQERRSASDDNCLKTYVEEIEKMDAILKVKIAEEKRVKMSRIKAEEESRSILGDLITSNVPIAVKINFREFINLLNQSDRTDFEGRKRGEEKMSDEEKDAGKECEKCERRERSSGASFIQKNIQLAKCGRGVLSLTDEEQLRVRHLLRGTEDGSQEDEGVGLSNMKNLYGLDDESKLILSEIDERLEILKKRKSLKECSGKLFFLRKTTEEGEKGEENERKESESESMKSDDGKRGKERISKRSRLEEIDELLSYVTSVSCEEIKPLAREDIESLVNQGRDGVDESSRLPETGNEKLIAELVSNAKSLMPKFKYRFDDS